MKVIQCTGFVLAQLLSTVVARAEPAQSADQAGRSYEITLTRDSSSQSSDGSSGGTHDQDTLIERIEAVRPDGLEAVFDLPPRTTKEERDRVWQFPARVLKQSNGQLKLLNAPDLEQRVDSWLKRGEMSREACGEWIFTWNAFKIECDPQSVIETIAAFAPAHPVLSEGALVRDARALRPTTLALEERSSAGSTYTALMAIDPKSIQRERAEADVVIGEILQEPVTLDAALAKRAGEAVSGTIEITINVDLGGKMRRLKKVVESRTEESNGTVRTNTVTETVERRLIS